VEAWAANLDALAGLTSAADTCFYFTGSGTAATFSCPSWARSVISAASASAGRTAFGLAIGSNVEAWDADLDGLAGLSTTGLVKRTGAGTFTAGVPAIADGGTGQITQQAAFDALAPTATRAGDLLYWDGSHYTHLAGNNSGTQVLQENPSGVPSWATISGTGTVTSVGCGTGLSGGTITTSGTCSLSIDSNFVENGSLGSPTAVNNAFLGFGSSCHVTMKYSTRLHVEIKGTMSENSGTGTTLTARWGIGTAPTLGTTSLTGSTQIGPPVSNNGSGTTGISNPYYVGGIISGLTVGQTVWFDVLYSNTSNNGGLSNSGCSAFEVM
jgi:hypothetical protein